MLNSGRHPSREESFLPFQSKAPALFTFHLFPPGLTSCAVADIEPPDTHHVNAALGWLELENPREAAEELKKLSAEADAHPKVMEVWWMIHARQRNWEAALTAARGLIAAAPDNPAGWIDQSFSLHELRRTQEAWDELLPAATRFPKVAVIPYNLACYACQLGHPREAMKWLKIAIKLDGAENVKERASVDPDLAPLRGQIENM